MSSAAISTPEISPKMSGVIIGTLVGALGGAVCLSLGQASFLTGIVFGAGYGLLLPF